MKTNIIKMYLHKKEDIKVIDFTFSEKVVRTYRNGEVIDTDKLSLRVSEFRNNSCCGTRIPEITELMSRCDCDNPITGYILDKVFLNAEVDIELTEISKGDVLDDGSEAMKDMIYKKMHIVSITDEGKSFINDPSGLRLELSTTRALDRIAEEKIRKQLGLI